MERARGQQLLQMSPEKAHMEATERIQANWQIRKLSEQNEIKGCSTVLENQRGKRTKGLGEIEGLC